MAGIYLHIPFCKQACSYCDFHFSTSLKQTARMVASLKEEIRQRKGFLKEETIETIYFGGGTPSILETGAIKEILQLVHQEFGTASPEITLEANPDDLTKEKLASLAKSGVNRLSIGIQSFFDRDLLLMGRAHSAHEAARAVANAQEAGFENITIDLIYGIPGQTIRQWQENVWQALELKVPHISCYCLTVEPKTKLDHQVRKGLLKEKDEELTEQEFRFLIGELQSHGYEHYELSNFARPGFISRHNSSYWYGKPYLGIGPSAHSFDGLGKRLWNISNNSLYMRGIETGKPIMEEENLNVVDQANEYLMTRLRTKEGIHKSEFISRFGEGFWNSIFPVVEKFIASEWLGGVENIALTEKGLFKCDYITRELFIIEV